MTARETGMYRVSTRGLELRDVGFMHCCWRHQVEPVANATYRDAGPVLLLTIDSDLVASEIKVESGGGPEDFPHVYGPLPVAAVVAAEPLEPAPGGLFVAPTSWVCPEIEVLPSPIDGLGLFATASIGAGQPVAIIGGRALSNEQFSRHITGLGHWSATAVERDVNVLQADHDPLSRGNHSCDPNLWMADELSLVARRPIQPHEEVTFDYALATVDERWSMKCRCRTTGCRGVITGSDWRRQDLRARYRGHFSPFIERG